MGTRGVGNNKTILIVTGGVGGTNFIMYKQHPLDIIRFICVFSYFSWLLRYWV